MTKQIRDQIIEVRNSGLANMFDWAMVQNVAELLELDELASYMEADNKEEYARFILTGRS